MKNFEYTPEMALLEIWGAIQMAASSYEGYCTMSKLKSMAREAVQRAGLLETEEERDNDRT